MILDRSSSTIHKLNFDCTHNCCLNLLHYFRSTFLNIKLRETLKLDFITTYSGHGPVIKDTKACGCWALTLCSMTGI